MSLLPTGRQDDRRTGRSVGNQTDRQSNGRWEWPDGREEDRQTRADGWIGNAGD